MLIRNLPRLFAQTRACIIVNSDMGACKLREIRWSHSGKWKNKERELLGIPCMKPLIVAQLFPISLCLIFLFFHIKSKLAANPQHFPNIFICPILNLIIYPQVALQTLHTWGDSIQSLGATTGEENIKSFQYNKKWVIANH